ncbi:hypothetical protein ACQZ6C_10820 [Rhizobium rhizogenes]
MEYTLTFNIQLNANGVIRFKCQAAAKEAGMVGVWFNGKPYQPDTKYVHDCLPFQYRKAFNRALKWWQTESMSGRSMPLMCNLTSLRGKPMGTLYATPNWVA